MQLFECIVGELIRIDLSRKFVARKLKFGFCVPAHSIKKYLFYLTNEFSILLSECLKVSQKHKCQHRRQSRKKYLQKNLSTLQCLKISLERLIYISHLPCFDQNIDLFFVSIKRTAYFRVL